MNSTIMVQKGIKDEAAQKAKKEGFSLSTVVRILLKGYVEGQVGLGLTINESTSAQKTTSVPLDKETQTLLDGSVKKWRHKFSEK